MSIDEGNLPSGGEVALPRQVLTEYESEVPHCRYLRKDGEPFDMLASIGLILKRLGLSKNITRSNV